MVYLTPKSPLNLKPQPCRPPIRGPDFLEGGPTIMPGRASLYGSVVYSTWGSWVVISGIISRVTTLITHIRGLITPLVTTHEPPSIPYTLEPSTLNAETKKP